MRFFFFSDAVLNIIHIQAFACRLVGIAEGHNEPGKERERETEKNAGRDGKKEVWR